MQHGNNAKNDRCSIIRSSSGGFLLLQYSRLSLSRLRLPRITAYLEEKIWSLL